MFENISIRGRIAYGICCLENFILSRNYPKSEWKILFDNLWTIHEMPYVDCLLDKYVELFPACVLEFPQYDEDWEYVDESTFNQLYTLYSKCPAQNEVTEILETIHEIGCVYVYSSTSPPAPLSLAVVNDELIPLMKKLNVVLPNVKHFQQFSIHERNCWGEGMSRDMINIPFDFNV